MDYAVTLHAFVDRWCLYRRGYSRPASRSRRPAPVAQSCAVLSTALRMALARPRYSRYDFSGVSAVRLERSAPAARGQAP
jgi:hypothetical protein